MTRVSASDLAFGPFRVSHRTVRLWLLLLPVWVIGIGEYTRFVTNNSTSGLKEANGFVKGRDFVQFYVAGTLATEGQWHALYDVTALKQEVARIVPAAAGDIPAPVYGPQVALLFAPLSWLPYITARWCWFIASAVLYIVGAALVMRAAAPLHGFRAIAWISLLCNPALAMLLATGQTGALAMLMWALAIAAAMGSRKVLCGACLGLLLYKPSLLIGAIPPLVILGCWRALAGIVISAVVQCGVTTMISGIDAWLYYFNSVTTLSRYYFLTDTIPHHKQSILGFFQLMLGSGPAAALLAAIAATGVLTVWWLHRGDDPGRWFVALLLVTTIVLSPHFYVYDLIVLTPALLVVSHSLTELPDSRRKRTLSGAGYAVLFAPYSGVFAVHSRFQVSTVVLTLLLVAVHQQWVACRVSR